MFITIQPARQTHTLEYSFHFLIAKLRKMRYSTVPEKNTAERVLTITLVFTEVFTADIALSHLDQTFITSVGTVFF